MTFDFAQVDQPPPPETQQLLGAVSNSQQAMNDFVSVQAGTLPIPEFFSPENIARIMAGEVLSARPSYVEPHPRTVEPDGATERGS